MSLDLVRAPRAELESMALADRIKLEAVASEVAEVARQLNDAEIGRLHEAGASQRAIAEAMGVSRTTAQRRLAQLGLAADPARPVPRNHPLPQNGDTPNERVAGEIVPDQPKPSDGPAHYLPDVVHPDADRNLRTQALRWFEQGRHLEDLLKDGATVEARDRVDRAALKREAAEMVRIARHLKGVM